MRRAILTLPVFVILGCPGGASDEVGTSTPGGSTSGASTSGTTGETVTPTTSETSVDPTTGSVDTSTSGSSSTLATMASEPDATTEAASTGETSAGEASTGAEESSGGDETTGGVDGDYAAFFLFGGLDRIMIRKRDVQNDLCTVVLFVLPMDLDPMGFTIELPGMWGVQSATIAEGAAQCLDDMMFPMDPVFATGGFGAATWAPEDGCPTTVDIDVELSFEMTMPWVPLQDHLDAQAIPVQGC
jgi:hypothetical protein